MNALISFENHKFLNVETYRKNGEGMQTPVWFVEYGGELYFSTNADSGKVKRIHAQPRVKIAPCNSNGELLGDWSPAVARIPQPEELAEVEQLYIQKYSLEKEYFERRQNSVIIALKPIQ